jgi:hypothetical protein
MIDYSLILKIKYPNIRYAITDNDYKTIIWDNKITYKPTKEELDSQWEEVLIIIKKEQCKSDAKQLIAKYDFAVLPDRSKDIENINEIISYRDSLLSLIKNPIENPEFPNPPEVIWK